MEKQKEGFIYIWYDSYRKMYYIGCHWGTIDDGYICSSRRMRDAKRNRPHDFKRRIIQQGISRETLLEEEFKWLSLIPDEQLGKKYYNISKRHFGHWSNDPSKINSVKKTLSERGKEAMNRPEVREKMKVVWESNKNRTQSSEEKEKRANSNRGKKRTLETRRRISEALSTPENKKKLSERASGVQNYFYGKNLLGSENGFFGKTHSEETRRLLSNQRKGHKIPNKFNGGGTSWWNNGSGNKRCSVCPGVGWIRGRIGWKNGTDKS